MVSSIVSRPRFRRGPGAAGMLVLLTHAGCEFVGSFIAGTPAAQLRKLTLADWITVGAPFMGDERFGVVTSVVELDTDRWEVRVPDPSALTDEVVWVLEIESVPVYRVFPSQEFFQFVDKTARDQDRRAGLNAQARTLILDGELVAVGEVNARYRRADRSGDAEVVHRAGYRITEPGGDPTWVPEPDSRSLGVLFRALGLTYQTMATSDERVMKCAGSATYGQDQATYLACAGDVLADDFGIEDTE